MKQLSKSRSAWNIFLVLILILVLILMALTVTVTWIILSGAAPWD